MTMAAVPTENAGSVRLNEATASAPMAAPQYMPLVGYPKAWTPGMNGEVKGEEVLLDVAKVEDLSIALVFNAG